MPGPAGDVRIQTSMRLPYLTYTRLQKQATQRNLSVNWLVTRAVELYLERLEEIPDES